jgi:hypothetical protein
LTTGQLVVYNNNGATRVGLVVGLDGKAKYWVLGEVGGKVGSCMHHNMTGHL